MAGNLRQRRREYRIAVPRHVLVSRQSCRLFYLGKVVEEALVSASSFRCLV